MDVTDRMVAIDRAVASYRRFVESDYAETAPDMISDLLHWYRTYVDRALDPSKIQALLDSAQVQYTEELVEFGLGNDPMRGSRRPTQVHDEVIFDPGADEPRSFRDVLEERRALENATPAPTPWGIAEANASIRRAQARNDFSATLAERPIRENEGHVGFDPGEACNCTDCVDQRAEDRGFVRYGAAWVTMSEYQELLRADLSRQPRLRPLPPLTESSNYIAEEDDPDF